MEEKRLQVAEWLKIATGKGKDGTKAEMNNRISGRGDCC